LLLFVNLSLSSHLSLSLSTPQVKEVEGMFKIDTGKENCASTSQTVEAVSRQAATPGILLTGVLSLPTTCSPNVFNYAVVIGLGAESANHLVVEATVTPRQANPTVHTVNHTMRKEAEAAELNTVILKLQTPATEQIYGLGVQYSKRNIKGLVVPVLTSEQGIGRGLQPLTNLLNALRDSGGNFHTTYSAIPHYTTSQLRSFFLENSEYSVFDMSAPEIISIQVYGDTLTGRAIYGASPLDHVEEYTAYAGRMPALPDWAMEGPIVGYEGGTAAVVALYNQLLAADITPAAFWLQDWSGLRVDAFGKRLWWNWELDEVQYPDWAGLAQNLSHTGTRLLTYINPYLANTVTADKPNFKRVRRSLSVISLCSRMLSHPTANGLKAVYMWSNNKPFEFLDLLPVKPLMLSQHCRTCTKKLQRWSIWSKGKMAPRIFWQADPPLSPLV
jgi:hypothetical protein